METSGTYHATSWLLVRVDEGTDWGVEQGKPIQRQVMALTRLGEVSSVEAAESLIRSRQKPGPTNPPPAVTRP